MSSSSLLEPQSLTMSLPDELVLDIIAHVPRRYYPTVSLVSKRFQSIVASTHLYKRRSLLGCTEHSLYTLIYNRDTGEDRLYILESNGSFVLIPSLPLMPSYASFVAVGSKIYVVGGYDRSTSGLTETTRAFAIDCRFHTVQSIPDIPKPMSNTVAEIIDGKIYVIGNYDSDFMVFDTKTQTWEIGMANPEIKLKRPLWGCCRPCGVVMADKIYLRDAENSFVYMPKENKWEIYTILNSMEWQHACAINDILYYYDNHKNKLRGYDTKHKCWRVVKGVETLFPTPPLRSRWGYTVSYGEKLVVFFPDDRISMTWCARIALERRQGGEIWGKVECCHIHLFDGGYFAMDSVTIMV